MGLTIYSIYFLINILDIFRFVHMEPIMTLVLIVSLVVCAYMAWNIGANDVALSLIHI